MDSKNILVTGFGPFLNNQGTNPSWAAVQLLPEKILGHTLIKKLIPVSYSIVDKVVPEYWKSYNRELVLHVGAGNEGSISLEISAHKDGYSYKDIDNCSPACGDKCAMETCESCMRVALDVHDICNKIIATQSTNVRVSENAGRYLCEYSFYTSLTVDESKTLFVHVPLMGKPYSAQELAQVLGQVIQLALEQRREMCNLNK